MRSLIRHLKILRPAFCWCLFFIALFSPLLSYKFDDEAERLLIDLKCTAYVTIPDHGAVIEELKHAYEWNKLLRDSKLAAIDQNEYYSTADVLNVVDGWTPQIACIAREFDLPPELLAGVLALELDLDYRLPDARADEFIRSPWGADLTGLMNWMGLEMGAGYAQVHFNHLRPALALLGPGFSTSAFYRRYYDLMTTNSLGDVTLLATRYQAIDLADAAVMARYYARLRMGQRSLSAMTTDDMAFVFSAYRGGVAGTPADPRQDVRWSVAYLQKADNPRLFGDSLIALPYFAYYHEVFRSLRFD